ncbi:PAB-dependent poly(A)-specific ribonuclease subunit 3 [Dermatophagoides farinae]|uniref:PAN2-PAN3 deadenylation complex subunit PAN3 n=2 Tax=Dermatophagoides farinae TaxID=6954 RepID=A0A922HR80_DERFA|nr:PAB-dependent poly(A)-specific ribonuclease subunit 3 [Dermatophagoides farinae]
MDGLLPSSTTTTNGNTKVINSFFPNPVTTTNRDYLNSTISQAQAVDYFGLDHQSTAGLQQQPDVTHSNNYAAVVAAAAAAAAATASASMPSESSHHHYGSTPYVTTMAADNVIAAFYDHHHHQQQQQQHQQQQHHHHHHHQQQQQQQQHQAAHVITSRLSQLNIDSTNVTTQAQIQKSVQYPNHDLNSSSSSSSMLQHQQQHNSTTTKPPPSSLLSSTSTTTTAAIITSQQQQQPQQIVDNSNASFFIADSIREELTRRMAKTQEMVSETTNIEIPAKVDVFIDLIQIEPLSGASSFTFNGMISTVYRGTNSETGQLFCLRRFHAFQPNTANAKLLMGTIESWKRIQHPNIIALRQVFTTKAFGDSSVIFVYDYHPLSTTIMSCYFSNQLNSLGGGHSTTMTMNGYSTSSRPYSQQQQNTRKFLPEQTIWNFIIQISSALRTIHQSNLAFRSLDPTKILITSGLNGTHSSANRGRDARVKLSFCGVTDILTLDTIHPSTNHRAFIQHLQQEDLILFGRLCLAIASNSLTAFTALQRDHHSNLQEYLDSMPRSYSNDLRNLIMYLISFKTNSANKPRSIDDIMPMIGARFYMQLDYFYLRYDYLYDELAKEVDNGRLLRLLSKLGTINERPEHQLDPTWSETGDRYMLKLFRDYLFHQCDEAGKPWLDLGHIISNLNKFDIGSPEKICLISRDAQNVIIVSFEELKRCFEAAINDLMQ